MSCIKDKLQIMIKLFSVTFPNEMQKNLENGPSVQYKLMVTVLWVSLIFTAFKGTIVTLTGDF